MLTKNSLIKIAFVSTAFLFFITVTHAQTRKPVTQKPVQPKQEVNIPLKLKPLWGNHPGGNMLVADGINYADSSLRVIDEKGNRYTVIHFKFIYRRKASITDDQTGTVKNTWDVVATDIYGETSLSEVWRNTIKESLQRDEEWIVDYITIKDKTGRKVMTTPMSFKFR